MPVVTKLSESAREPGRWYAEIDGGDTLRVDLALIADYSLYAGRSLTAEELSALAAAAAKRNARARAMRLLGYRPMSRRELVDKLLEKGESADDAAGAADYLEQLGYLNDGQYARSLVRHYSSRGYGPARVRQELFRHGVPRELWEEALEELPEDSGAIDTIIERRLRGRRPEERELRRLKDMLLRRGFNWGDIRDALARFDFSEGIENE